MRKREERVARISYMEGCIRDWVTESIIFSSCLALIRSIIDLDRESEARVSTRLEAIPISISQSDDELEWITIISDGGRLRPSTESTEESSWLDGRPIWTERRSRISTTPVFHGIVSDGNRLAHRSWKDSDLSTRHTLTRIRDGILIGRSDREVEILVEDSVDTYFVLLGGVSCYSKTKLPSSRTDTIVSSS